MTTKGHSIRKTISRSSIIFVLVLSILLSSISVSFASIEIPDDHLYTVGELITLDGALDWVENWFTQDPNGYLWILSDTYVNTSNLQTEGSIRLCFCSADTSIYFNDSTSSVYLSSTQGFDMISVNYIYGYQYNYGNISANQGPNSSNYVTIDGTNYYRYNFTINTARDCKFYCSKDFIDNGGDVPYNLDVSTYLPPAYYLEAHLSDDNEFVWIDVNFNVDAWGSLVSLWGYNDYGATPFNYGRDEYLDLQFDMGTDGIHSIFKVPLASFRASYLGQDFTIVSVSVMGWEDGHEEYLTVDWHLSELTPGEYNPPTYNYYNTYYNQDYTYAEKNGNVVAFGNVDICLYSDAILDRVFWDKQETLITPYKYSYVFIPNTVTSNTVGDRYYRMIDELVLEFDIVINNCPTAVFDAMYGQGAAADFAALTNLQDTMMWYTSHFRYYDLIPYEYFNNLPTENYQSYDCTCFYTDSFYFKSLAYLLGDSNERLLEFESRLLGEDGAWKALIDALESSYNSDFSYYSDMLTYMNKLNFLVFELTSNDYFAKYLLHLESIDSKLSDIADSLTAVNEEDFDNRLQAPWLQIYRYFKTLFNRSLVKLPDFLNTTAEILDGGSDQVGIGFTLDNDYEQALPLNSPSVSPTPIPIPTLFP